MALGHLDLPGNLVCQNYPKNRNASFILYNCMYWYQIPSGKKKKNLCNDTSSWITHFHKDSLPLLRIISN